MNLSLLQTLTWSTVAGAFVSALALASVEPVVPGHARTTATRTASGPAVLPAVHLDEQPALPAEPAAAGLPPRPANGTAGSDGTAYAVR